MNATHTYKGKSVELIELTYQFNGQQYCTIKMLNKTGKEQLQTIQFRRLEEKWEPREYKSISFARRAGRRECMKHRIVPFRVITLGAIYLVVGNDEFRKFETWLEKHEIPINWKRDSHVTYVWEALYSDK